MLLALGLATGAGASWANRLVGDVITGQITAISGVDAVSIGGQMYSVQAGSAASQVLPTLAVGQIVDAMLNGPASTSQSQVISISLHTGP